MFISAESFIDKFSGRAAALHYLNTVFLPRAKESAAHGVSMTEVYRYEQYPTPFSQDVPIDEVPSIWKRAKADHGAHLHDLLKEAGWNVQANLAFPHDGPACYIIWAWPQQPDSRK